MAVDGLSIDEWRLTVDGLPIDEWGLTVDGLSIDEWRLTIDGLMIDERRFPDWRLPIWPSVQRRDDPGQFTIVNPSFVIRHPSIRQSVNPQSSIRNRQSVNLSIRNRQSGNRQSPFANRK
jgi:hypothetical protein